MRPIDADALEEIVHTGLRKNPHKNGFARVCHISEYTHFLDVILRMPTITQPPNDPLTLDELREMDGEPVWVKVSENWRESGIKDGWRLVRLHKSDDRLRLYFYDTHFGPTFVAEQDYVQSWIAYRRRPEEEQTK